MSERMLGGIFVSLAASGAVGLALILNLTEPSETGNRLVFFVVFLVASLGLLGLLAQKVDPRRGRRRNPLRALRRGGIWAVLLTAMVVLLSERLLNVGNGVMLVAIGGLSEILVWNRR